MQFKYVTEANILETPSGSVNKAVFQYLKKKVN